MQQSPYASFAELEAACEVFCEEVNTRVHRVTRRAPVEMLAEELTRLHPVPASRSGSPGGAGLDADGLS